MNQWINVKEARAHIEAGRLGDADALCRKELELDPASAEAHHLSGHNNRGQTTVFRPSPLAL